MGIPTLRVQYFIDFSVRPLALVRPVNGGEKNMLRAR